MLSNRLPPHAELNPLSRVLERLKAAGTPVADLTESNPTRVGLHYPDGLLNGLASAEGLHYEPQPLGLRTARAAVAADYLRRGARIAADQVVLTASTSEAYSWVFKLLCSPGDAVLVPEPSYPLFEHLTRLEAVRPVPYSLGYHGRWEIDLSTVDRAPSEVRAVLLVSPNNPTGSYVSREEARRLGDISRHRGWALVADEVFADYPLETEAPVTECAIDLDVLSFTLGGASKSLGLPQLKLGWMVVSGPEAQRNEALAGLEVIADAFLSVGTPVQVAAPGLLARGEATREQIRRRIAHNLGRARSLCGKFHACTILPIEGGWSLVLRVPATRPEEALVVELLEREHVLVHPGYFFDFPHESFLVVSLLPEERLFADAFERVLQFACTDALHQ